MAGSTGPPNSVCIRPSLMVKTFMLNLRHVTLSVSDDDGDEVRCRWAEAAKRECADVCQTFTGSVLDEVQETTSFSAV